MNKKKIITVNDLIKALQEADPSGTMKVAIDTTGCDEYENLVVKKVKPLGDQEYFGIKEDEEIIAIDSEFMYYGSDA